ncbi:hypothetical protein P3T16_000249 [Paraburkholderia sp. GAS42]|jgi:hypothetical protein
MTFHEVNNRNPRLEETYWRGPFCENFVMKSCYCLFFSGLSFVCIRETGRRRGEGVEPGQHVHCA